MVEYLVDDTVMKPILTELLGRTWVDEGEDRESQKAYLDNLIEFWCRMGYDFVKFERRLDFPENQSSQTIPLLAHPNQELGRMNIMAA